MAIIMSVAFRLSPPDDSATKGSLFEIDIVK